ncbi:MAG: MobC family plasmid mobilization relaxosome protein [Butyrivibrio sp.]|nr:MobC family plasmid mobilization relaxosome protein [Butyrivibrio sp.]
MQNEGRTIPIQIYLTEEEKQILDIKYRMSKSRSRGAYIRKMILEGYVYDVDFSELKRYNFLMSNIATNVNQIAHRINETRSIFQHDIDELKEEIRKLWQLQRSIQSNLPWAKQSITSATRRKQTKKS